MSLFHLSRWFGRSDREFECYSPVDWILYFSYTHRFAACCLLRSYITPSPTLNEFGTVPDDDHVTLIRRVLFSRSLRLLPLPQQIGVVEGLIAIVKVWPQSFALSDQHILACLSELLKMASVADGEMTDDTLKQRSADKDGFIAPNATGKFTEYPSHSSSLFLRRDCIFFVHNSRFFLQGELPAGVQLRVSTIKLLHIVVEKHSNLFFEAEAKGAIGTIYFLLCFAFNIQA
jgi:hypothetical protein